MGSEKVEGKSKMFTIPTPTATPTPTLLSRLGSFLFTVIEFVSPSIKIEKICFCLYIPKVNNS